MTTLNEIRQSGQRRAPRNARERRMRWTTGPDHDPLTSLLERRGRRVVAGSRLETIHPYVTPPWQSNLEPCIAETQEAALESHQAALRAGATVIAYTDGSLTEHGVGATVVSTLGSQADRISSPTTHTVYAAELRGVEMTLAQIHSMRTPETQRPNHAQTAIIFTDNRAAVRACSVPAGPLASTSCVRSPSWLLIYRNAGGAYSCNGSLATRAFMVMNVLMLWLGALPTP